MTTKKLKWGLLSTAHINRALIPVLKASTRNDLVAVASRSQAAAEAYAREWGIQRAHASYEALLEDPEIDLIYNSLPNHLHAEWSIKAMRAGKHVLCEKPLALTLADVDSMRAEAQQSGKVLAEAFMYRHHPQTLAVQKLVEDGELGRLQLVRGAFTFPLSGSDDIRLKADTGGGSIWDVGCYPISYARLLARAEPEEVFGWQVLGDGGVDEAFAGQLRFRGGLYAQFDSGLRSPSRSFMEVVGTEGTLNVPVPFKPGARAKIALTKGDVTRTLEIKGEELYRGEVEDMADAVLVGSQPRMSLADSRGNVAAILALIESARTGKPVML
jgi:predicted dehydrogenase